MLLRQQLSYVHDVTYRRCSMKNVRRIEQTASCVYCYTRALILVDINVCLISTKLSTSVHLIALANSYSTVLQQINVCTILYYYNVKRLNMYTAMSVGMRSAAQWTVIQNEMLKAWSVGAVNSCGFASSR